MTINKIARWDKLKRWSEVKQEIQERLSNEEKSDDSITLDIGPQLLYTLRHPSALRCMEHTESKLGDVFTCHYNKGAVQGVRVWLIQNKDKNGAAKNIGFETDYEITSMTYVTKHRVYLVFSSYLVLRIFTDSRSNFVEVDYLPCLTTTLCLMYNKEEDVVYSGGIGFMEEWKIHGAEHAASIVPGRKFLTDLTRNDWVRDIKIVKQNNIIIGQHGNGLCVVHTKTGKQLHRLPNRHEGPLKCCCYYRPNDFLITGGADGKIKFYNGTAFNLLHVIIGHHGPVTDLEPHSKDTLLFSSSHDGTIRIWRLDTQQIFYEFFSGVESETKILLCCKGKGRPNKILGSAEELIDKLEEGQSKKLLKEVAIRQPAIILDVAAMLSKDQPPSEPEPSASSPSWCICTMCPPMVRDEVKVCCGMAPQYCNSRRPEMRISIIDPLTLHIQQTFRNDVFAEHAVSLEDTNRAYRHAAYRQYTLWVHGRLSKDDRRTVPACCVKIIRDKYPSPIGQYRGFEPSRHGVGW